MVSFFDRVYKPELYHGKTQKAPFFEGWYYKLVSKDEKQRFAIIPGVYMHLSPGKSHSFIQVLNGTTGETAYHQFPLLQAKDEEFHVRIGDMEGFSEFSKESLKLDAHNDAADLTGELRFKDLKPWPIQRLSPGYMGWFGFIPNLDTNHAVLSFDHEIEGAITINGETIDFTGGRGYIEKDWGRSFPESYVWFQSNHFDTVGTSLTASFATLKGSPLTPDTGFGVGFLHEGTLYRFMTYTDSSIHAFNVSDETVEWVLYNDQYTLKLNATRAEGGALKGPERTDMSMRVEETMNALVEVELIKHKGNTTIFSGKGRNAGLEVVGDMTKLSRHDNNISTTDS